MSKELKKPQKNKKFNRLANEKSPYLLQHAENPVDWYPWSEEAFERARKEDKPIFLSIGYSTCHWCHVMAHESFEDPEVAEKMNEVFVSIKVDREERPDIDSLYMSVCQMLTGSGGWPLTIIMDADKRPFTAGTYFPKNSRFGRIGMMELIPRIQDFWVNQRETLENSAQDVMEQINQAEFTPGEEFSIDILDEAFKEASLLFDEKLGGFKTAPKFPTPHKMMFLLRYWKRTGNEQALHMVEKTLQAMRNGGIFDHIGFGFHRYSTDSSWLLPHFEKMLYDQALLAIAYIEAYQTTHNAFYREVAEEIFAYVLRDMTSPVGGFYSAEDADSEGEEGKFYVWEIEEIEQILAEEDKDLFLKIYNFESGGNFYDQATQEKTGGNIPHLTKPIEKLASDLSTIPSELEERLEGIRQKLFTIREKRTHPHKDDKILVDWNGLMITALALGGRVFENKEYITAAQKATDFILGKMLTKDNRLYHRYRDGEAAIQGMVDDYAFFVWGLLELYQTTFAEKYLRHAIELNTSLLDNFWDEKNGGLFISPKDGENLLVRKKEIYDGAIPSGNSVSMLNFLKIGRILGDVELEAKVSQINKVFSTIIEQSLFAYAMFLTALEYIYGSSFEVVIVGKRNAKDTKKMLKSINSYFIPHKVLLFVPLGHKSPEIHSITDFAQYKESIEDKATAHVCINRFCKFPTNEIESMLNLLKISNIN